MKIIISDKTSEECAKILRDAGHSVDEKFGISGEDLKQIINQYDGIIIRSATKITGELLENASNLKLIGRAGTGVDNIDLAAAKRKNIAVMNTPGANTNAVAELALGFMLILSRNLNSAINSTRAGKWEKKNLVGNEIQGKTIGILGYNRVGRLLARKCRLLGMSTVCFDPKITKHLTDEEGLEIIGSLDTVLGKSDFVSIHLSKRPDTENFLNEGVFQKFRPGTVFINCSRGGIVDESALLGALEAGIVAAAATDVFAVEPPGDCGLLKHPNVICTPHIGASTQESQKNVGILIAEQFVDYFSGNGARNIL